VVSHKIHDSRNTNTITLNTYKKDLFTMLDMLQAKRPLTAEDAKVSKVERKVSARDALTTVGRGAPCGDPLFDASLAVDGRPRVIREVPWTDQHANVSSTNPWVPIITDKFTVLGLNDTDCHGDVLMLEASKAHRHQEDVPSKGMVHKFPLTVDDTRMLNVKHRLPNAVANANIGLVQELGGNPLLEASMAQHAGPWNGVVHKLPLTVVDACISNMEHRVPPPQNPVQDRGEPVGDPLLDATLEEEEEDVTTAEGTGVHHLDVRHKMKSKFPCTAVVGPEDVHREVGPPKA
jgi:hypothetical protein